MRLFVKFSRVFPALLVFILPCAAQAQRQSTASLQVSARVAPTCSIVVETPFADAATAPSIRVVCGRSGLRALQVSTGPDLDASPAVSMVGRQGLAGGEVVFTVPVLLGAVASGSSMGALPGPNTLETVVLTLQF